MKGRLNLEKLKKKVILGLNNEKKFVLSLGGGSILSKNIRNLLNKKFITVFP